MRHITHCLNTRLVEICERTIQLETLDLIINNYLPEELKTRCHVGSFNQGCLILTIDCQSWATQLRFMLPELRDFLRREAKLYQLSSIKITIITPSNRKKKSSAKLLSNNARTTIRNSADKCTYEPLKEALYKLTH